MANELQGYNVADSEPADIVHMPENHQTGDNPWGERTGRTLTDTRLLNSQRGAGIMLSQRAKMVARMHDPDTSEEDRENIRFLLEVVQPLMCIEVKNMQKAAQNRVRITASALEKRSGSGSITASSTS